MFSISNVGPTVILGILNKQTALIKKCINSFKLLIVSDKNVIRFFNPYSLKSKYQTLR